MTPQDFLLCPGQGAQRVGMGRAWSGRSDAARRTFEEADEILDGALPAPVSRLCFEGPGERLDSTAVAQPAIYVCSVACARGLAERDGRRPLAGAAGLSLGEYTALHLAGAFDFAAGLRLVTRRGRLMQEAAEATDGSMLALIGADDEAAESICREAAGDDVLVCANFNAPGQVVLSGQRRACDRAAEVAGQRGVQARPLAVAGAFHSPLMRPAAEGMRKALAEATLEPPEAPVWSNVTGRPHDRKDPELLRRRLVEQITSPVLWSRTCRGLEAGPTIAFRELAPGTTLRGLMRRIDRTIQVTSHDEP